MCTEHFKYFGFFFSILKQAGLTGYFTEDKKAIAIINFLHFPCPLLLFHGCAQDHHD